MLVKQSDIRAILMNKLCGEGSLMRVPEGADYSAEDATNVLLHAATSSSDSIEAAVQDLQVMYPISRIPCADTVHTYMKENDVGEMMSFFRKMNSEFIDMLDIGNSPQTVAMDFHTIPYYGDKNTKGVVGIQPKNGTSWGYSYLTADLVEGCKLTLDIVNLTALNKNYGTLIEGVINRINQLGIAIDKILMDREFFNLASIITLDTANINYVMPAKLDKRIKKILRDFEMAEGMVPGVIKHKFRDKSSPNFYLVIVPNKNYNPSKREGKDNKKFFVFATSIKFDSVKEFTKNIPKEYRKRWNIETGYRMKNIFKIRTCSKSGVVRSLFFILRCIMHNCLNVLKQVVSITAYTLKSAICEGIRDCLHVGSDLIRNQSIVGFYNRVKRYNEDRELQSRQHLGLV
uniref:Transposase IS4-like domain-containing protein n=1 Tax=uncultured Methanosarcinales archaeon TaxID=183757 RepID=A0A7H1KP09_9EURY|nr:hypothetical protein HAHEADPM_00007 [uncultured Methanosarcinales archaeon]